VGRWIGSTKNIVGGVLAVLAVGAQALFGLGPFWLAIVAVSYVVGALLAPRERIDLQLGLGSGADADDLERQLALLRRSLKGEARRLPDDVTAVLGRILDALDQVVARWPDLSGAPEQRHTVEAMVTDYLPTSLQTYLNLPRTFALSSRVEGQRSAHDELLEQLGILETESARIRDALYSREVDKLGDQSRFLREKFGKSSLEL
jgi:hypothetical protein